jgi:hypothetical protein
MVEESAVKSDTKSDTTSIAGAAALQVTLLPSTLSVAAGAPVPLQMQVHNPTAAPVTFCTYHTLFEGLRNNLFIVGSDVGVEVPYRGLMAKRAAPSSSDYRTLRAGETIVSQAVNIGEGYALKAGRSRVTFEGNGISGLSASAPIVVDVVPPAAP